MSLEGHMKLDVAIAKLETLYPYVSLLRQLDGPDSQYAETARQEVEYLLRQVWDGSDPEFQGSYLDELGYKVSLLLEVVGVGGDEAEVLERLRLFAVDDLANCTAEPGSLNHGNLCSYLAFMSGVQAYMADPDVSWDDVRNSKAPTEWVLDTFPRLLDRSQLVKAWLEGWNAANMMDKASQFPGGDNYTGPTYLEHEEG